MRLGQRQQALLVAAIRRLSAGALYGYIRTWQVWAQDCRHERRVLWNIVTRMKHASTAAAWDAWITLVDHRVHDRRIVQVFPVLRMVSLYTINRAESYRYQVRAYAGSFHSHLSRCAADTERYQLDEQQ